MYLDLPPQPKLWTPPKPAIIQSAEPWQNEVNQKLVELGVSRNVRRSVVSELTKLRGERQSVIRPTAEDLAKWAGIDKAMFPFPVFCPASTPAPAITSSYITQANASFVISTSNTFSNVSVGTADSLRYVLVGVSARSNGNGSKTISSVTVAGNAATLLFQSTPQNDGSNYYDVVGFAIIALPTGTTANIAVTCSGTMYGFAVAVWKIINLQSTTPVATDTSGGTSPMTGSTNVSAGGAAFGVAISTTGGADTFTWSGLTERYDVSQNVGAMSGASDDFASAQSPLSISATPTAGGTGATAAFVSLR